MSNIEKWKKTLNWNLIPEFKSIHSLPESRFMGCYYLPETVDEFIKKIISSVIDGYGFNHKTIVGDPGIGKTTFIYYLKTFLKNNGINENFYMEILHIQRMVTKENYENVIEERVLKILNKFFSANGHSAAYETITSGTNNTKIMINNLEDFLIENKNNFSKKLIIVIDDVDETDEKTVDASLRYFYSLVECEQITKWLIARATTLNNYNQKLIEFIETKFPQRQSFPKVDLFGIIEKRIKHDNPNGINPFTRDLCHLMLSTNNNDLRISVANAISFLENTEPPVTAKNNPNFAGQFLIKNFTKVMTQINVFPNIYKSSISRTFPIEKDVFLILATHNRFMSGYLKPLENHYRLAYEKNHKGRYIEESYLINLDMDHVSESIHFLKNNRIIFEHERIKDFYRLTPKGESFIRFVTEHIYTDDAKIHAEHDSEAKHPVFWDLAKTPPDYAPLSSKQISPSS